MIFLKTFIFFCALYFVSAENEPIKLTLYYETLCPDTRDFVLNELAPTYNGPLQSNIILTLVPFGNARFVENNGQTTVECQHKEPECYGNQLQACFIAKFSPNIGRSFDYVKCMFEKDNWKLINETAVECATELDLKWTDIEQCADSAEGRQFIADFGNQTLNLVPKLDWIPRIDINDIHTEAMRDEALFGLKKYLCDYHFNNQTLEACKSGAIAVVLNFFIFALITATQMLLKW